MFDHFTPRHIPPLLVATIMALGGVMPFVNPERSISAFGLPPRIAASPSAHSLMACTAVRGSAIGLALWTLYGRRQLMAMDTVLASLGCVALVDTYVCLKEGVPRKAIFRATSLGVTALWGLFGMTAGEVRG